MKNANTISRYQNSFLIIIVLLITTACEKKVALKEFTSNRGRFAVMAPGVLEKTTKTINTPVGLITLTNFIISKPNVAYIVSYSDYPDELINRADPQSMLDGSRDEMLRRIDGKLISEERVSYDEDPARELHYTVKGGLGKGHTVILLSGRRLYQIGAIGSKDNFPSNTVKKYVDSFEIW